MIVRPDHRRRGVGGALTRSALYRGRDRRLVALVSTPAAVPSFAAMGLAQESHGHQATHPRPHATAHEHDPV